MNIDCDNITISSTLSLSDNEELKSAISYKRTVKLNRSDSNNETLIITQEISVKRHKNIDKIIKSEVDQKHRHTSLNKCIIKERTVPKCFRHSCFPPRNYCCRHQYMEKRKTIYSNQRNQRKQSEARTKNTKSRQMYTHSKKTAYNKNYESKHYHKHSEESYNKMHKSRHIDKHSKNNINKSKSRQIPKHSKKTNKNSKKILSSISSCSLDKSISYEDISPNDFDVHSSDSIDLLIKRTKERERILQENFEYIYEPLNRSTLLTDSSQGLMASNHNLNSSFHSLATLVLEPLDTGLYSPISNASVCQIQDRKYEDDSGYFCPNLHKINVYSPTNHKDLDDQFENCVLSEEQGISKDSNENLCAFIKSEKHLNIDQQQNDHMESEIINTSCQKIIKEENYFDFDCEIQVKVEK